MGRRHAGWTGKIISALQLWSEGPLTDQPCGDQRLHQEHLIIPLTIPRHSPTASRDISIIGNDQLIDHALLLSSIR